MVGSVECEGPAVTFTEQQENDIVRMLNQESYNMHYGLRNGSYSLRTNSEARIDISTKILKILGYCIKEVESVKAPDGVKFPIYKVVRYPRKNKVIICKSLFHI